MKKYGWFFDKENVKYIPKVIVYPSIGQLTKNFHRSEFDCLDGTEVPYKFRFNLIRLAVNSQIIRDDLDAPIYITSRGGSGYRTPSHNDKVGGVSDSQHLTASADDMHQDKETPLEFYRRIERLIKEDKVQDGGLFLYNTFVHYDNGPAERRGNYSTRWKI